MDFDANGNGNADDQTHDTIQSLTPARGAPVWAYQLRRNVPDLSPETTSMTSLDELRVLASQHAACPDALTALDAARSLGDLLSHPRAPEYAHWLRRSVPDLAPEARTLTEQMAAEQTACQSPEWAYRLRDAVFDLAPVTTP